MNNYFQQFRRFVTSQYLSTGLKMTLCVLVPSVVLYQYGLLEAYMAFPLGCLCVGLTDAPGPLHYRRNGLFAATALSWVLVLLAGYSAAVPWLLGAELLMLGFACGIAGVFGNRINSIALVGLLIFIFHIDGQSRLLSPWQHAWLFAAGGLLYTLITLALWQVRPFFLVQQVLAEHLHTIAGFLRKKAAFYQPGANAEKLVNLLVADQVIIHQQQEDLREMIFKTRSLINEGTARGRHLTMAFLDSIDLFELVMTSQQDYAALHTHFGQSGMMQQIEKLLLAQANALDNIALALPLNQDGHACRNLEPAMRSILQQFMQMRNAQMHADNLDAFIRLRQLLYALEDMVRRMQKLEKTVHYEDEEALKQRLGKRTLNLEKFVTGSGFRRKLLVDNLNLRSIHFRHALRIALALLAGYVLGQVAELGHAYWILLTIVTILKPSYSITKTRNWHRLLGTLAGAVVGFGALYLTSDARWHFGLMIVCMLLAYTFMRIQYLVSTFGITVYVILSTAFLDSAMVGMVLQDRLIDTVLGCAIAWMASVLLFPLWERSQMRPLIRQMIDANAGYFEIVSNAFLPVGWTEEQYKLARKEAMLALANMSDNFQRMMSEPKEQKSILPYYQQFVNSSHMLTSYIASLAYYARNNAQDNASPHFEPVVRRVQRQFVRINQLWDDRLQPEGEAELTERSRTLFDTINRLLSIRKASLAKGGAEVSLEQRKQLSILKTIADQFLLLETVVKDQRKILEKMKRLEEPAAEDKTLIQTDA